MGPKKPKKTKAELEEEKLAREEEERKQRIIEDKRLAEEHERQRLEKLRIEEEYRQLRQSELDRLTIEAQDYFDNLEDRKQQLVAEEKKSVSFTTLFAFHMFYYLIFW